MSAPEDSSTPIHDHHGYTEDIIQKYEGLEAVRKRPNMYIPGTGIEGLHHLVFEVVDNSIDEALAGYCSNILVTILPNLTVSVEDDGRGIPVGQAKNQDMSALELVMTTLHAGGKMDDKSAYKTSGGLHGVGVSVVNALSEWCCVDVMRDGYLHRQEYRYGDRDSDVRKIEKLEDTYKTGTKTTFRVDREIFKEDPTTPEKLNYNSERMSHRLREMAYLNPGLRIELTDKQEDEEKVLEFHYAGGITEMVSHQCKNREGIQKSPIFYTGVREEIEVSFSLQYVNDYSERVFCYTNNIPNREGGTHLIGFRSALTKTLNDIMKALGKDKKARFTLSGEDTREGLVAVISVRLSHPQFRSNEKTRLNNIEVRRVTDAIVGEGIRKAFDHAPISFEAIIDKCIETHNVREKVRRAREAARGRKTALNSNALPGKLTDCSDKDPKNCELFLVEGDSAGGTARQARNREFQAVLPLRGKVLNVERVSELKVLENTTLQPVIQSMGTGIGTDFDITRLRYHKVIIMSDADVDGSHIRTLILTFLYRYCRNLIEAGHVYIACPPLYKVSYRKKEEYAHTDEDLAEILAKYGEKNPNSIDVQRYKGLGEMNADQLAVTTMDINHRRMIKIDMGNMLHAEEIIQTLMGTDVEGRRDIIEKHGAKIENLDI